MVLRKRIYQSRKKIFIYGSGTLFAFFIILFLLNSQDITVQTSGDIVCAGTYSKPCISYFSISLSDYSVCFGSTFSGIYMDNITEFELYKADLRYRPDNPERWKLYNFSAGKCLERNKVHEFKIIGYKNPSQTVTWGVSKDKTSKWIGLYASEYSIG